jgi:hypothetical protein
LPGRAHQQLLAVPLDIARADIRVAVFERLGQVVERQPE